MSGVNKEAHLTVEEPTPATMTTENETPTQKTKTESTETIEVNTATTLETVTEGGSSAAKSASDKSTKIFGSFTSSLPDSATKKDESGSVGGTPSKPLFGGFMAGTSSASAWSAPTTIGGFGSASSFASKPAEEQEDRDEVRV